MTQVAEDIAEIKTDMKWVKKTLLTHVNQHFLLRLALMGSLITSGTAILIAIL